MCVCSRGGNEGDCGFRRPLSKHPEEERQGAAGYRGRGLQQSVSPECPQGLRNTKAARAAGQGGCKANVVESKPERQQPSQLGPGIIRTVVVTRRDLGALAAARRAALPHQERIPLHLCRGRAGGPWWSSERGQDPFVRGGGPNPWSPGDATGPPARTQTVLCCCLPAQEASGVSSMRTRSLH